MKEKEGFDLKNSMVERSSPKDFDHCTIVGNYKQLQKNHASVKSLDVKGKSLSRMPKAAEKLWDGSLQLSSSLTVSTVAFFKSGEKMPHVNWSESVEVKGKVKLEAFETFVQDIRRSRNRGLMVISLRWKEGSSKSGLVDLKEVAKGYKEGGRVGFARVAPGIDLYICPRTDTIITILAKHGFFKGMVAVEDNPDSLIGCVVWRRNQFPSISVAKKSDRKSCSSSKRPLNLASESSNKRTADKDSSHEKLANESIATTSGVDCTALGSTKTNRNEGTNMLSSTVQLELHETSILLPTASVQSDSSSVSIELVPSPCRTMSQSVHMRTLTENSEMEKVKSSLEPKRAVFSVPPVIRKKKVSAPDDDDLPEFDFGSTCASLTSNCKPLDAASVDMILPTEGSKKIEGMLSKTIPGSAPSKRKWENFNHPGIPALREVNEAGHINSSLILEIKQSSKSRNFMRPIGADTVGPPKNLFDDDDDMPEWSPPDVKLRKQSILNRSRPLTAVPSEVLNSSSEVVTPGLPSSLFSRPLAPHPPFPSQPFPHANQHPVTFSMKMAQPRPTGGYPWRGSTSLIGFSSSSHLALPLKPFDYKLPLQPPGWRCWRP